MPKDVHHAVEPLPAPPLKGYEILEWAMDVVVEDAVDRLVLLAYARHRNHASGVAFLSMERLERYTLRKRKAIIPARGRLIQRRLLIPAGRRGSTGVTQYRLGIPETGTPTDAAKMTVDVAENGTASAVDNPAAEVPETGTATACSTSPSTPVTVPETGTSGDPKTGTQNPVIEPRMNPESARGAPLSSWTPEDEDRRRAAAMRPDVNLEAFEAKFLGHHDGCLLTPAEWRQHWDRWLRTERVSERDALPVVKPRTCVGCGAADVLGSVAGQWHCAARACRERAMFGEPAAQEAA